MKIPIKTKDEIEIMKEGGKRLKKVMDEVLKQVKPGVRLNELDQLADSLIKKSGGKPSFKMVSGYHWATCINVNEGVVHGIPGEYRIVNGDLVSVDSGIFYKGFHTDMTRSLLAEGKNQRTEKDEEKGRFLKIGERALEKAIAIARPGNRIGHLSLTIEREIKEAGFSPIRALTGHGVGKKLHEDPQIPCFLNGKIRETIELKPGMTLAIEVIYAQGKPEVFLGEDGWLIKTFDGSLAGLFEDTIAVTEGKPLILTS